jgi:hypothetical protein
MQSQFSYESQIESQLETFIKSKFRKDDKILSKFKTYKEPREIPFNITWEIMKQKYGWGYKKGSVINPLITWIYLRPDLKYSLDNESVESKDIAKRFILNEHYFITESKAIAYLKLHCAGITETDANEENSSSTSSDESEDKKSLAESELSFQTLKRRRLSSVPIGIDDFAVEEK